MTKWKEGGVSIVYSEAYKGNCEFWPCQQRGNIYFGIYNYRLQGVRIVLILMAKERDSICLLRRFLFLLLCVGIKSCKCFFFLCSAEKGTEFGL